MNEVAVHAVSSRPKNSPRQEHIYNNQNAINWWLRFGDLCARIFARLLWKLQGKKNITFYRFIGRIIWARSGNIRNGVLLHTQRHLFIIYSIHWTRWRWTMNEVVISIDGNIYLTHHAAHRSKRILVVSACGVRCDHLSYFNIFPMYIHFSLLHFAAFGTRIFCEFAAESKGSHFHRQWPKKRQKNHSSF